MLELEVEIPAAKLVDVDRLQVDQDNPNRMGARQLEALKKSVQRWGFIVPIITNKELLVADGEQRLTVARELGMKQVSVIRLPVEDVDRRLLRQVLNKLRGEHELRGDALEFQCIIEAGYGESLKELLLLHGSQIERYLEELAEYKESPTPVVKETSIKQGDFFSLGSHRLMCGDATVKDDVERLMDGQKADMVFTDPPYGIAFQPEGKTLRPKALGPLKSDEDYRLAPREFPLLKKSLPLIVETCRPGAPLYVCTGWQEISLIQDTLMEHDCHVYSVLVWDRMVPRLLPRPQDFIPVNEFIVYGWKKGKPRTYINCLPDTETSLQKTTLWRIRQLPTEQVQHITEKPPALARNAIFISSEKDAVVADYFAGSGSTLIACEQTGRHCRMMEIDPLYSQLIIDRWQAYTSEKAVKLN